MKLDPNPYASLNNVQKHTTDTATSIERQFEVEESSVARVHPKRQVYANDKNLDRRSMRLYTLTGFCV
jgi:hypothetical protein